MTTVDSPARDEPMFPSATAWRQGCQAASPRCGTTCFMARRDPWAGVPAERDHRGELTPRCRTTAGTAPENTRYGTNSPPAYDTVTSENATGMP